MADKRVVGLIAALVSVSEAGGAAAMTPPDVSIKTRLENAKAAIASEAARPGGEHVKVSQHHHYRDWGNFRQHHHRD